MKTEAKRRRDRRIYMRQYRADKAMVNVQRHPTLSNEELDALEEVIGMCAAEEAAEYGRPRTDAHMFAPRPVDAAEDARLTAEIASRSQEQPKPAELESTIRIPAAPDLPNGIIR